MKFVIVTTTWLEEKGIDHTNFRKSLDGTQAVVHREFLTPVLTDEEMEELTSVNLRQESVLSEYEHDSQKFKDILNSEEWSNQEEP